MSDLRKELSNKEHDLPLESPAYITLLAANAYGKLDKDEICSATQLAHIKTSSCDSSLRDFYKEVTLTFDQNLDHLDNSLPIERISRTSAIKVKLSEIENILKKLGKKYGTYGQDWEHGEEFEKVRRNQSSRQRAYSTSQNGDDFSDFFESMFGGIGQSGRQVRFRGEDFKASFQMSLLDEYKTHQQTLTANEKNIRITLPAGIDNGQTPKIKNHGGPETNGGPNGDLYVTFSIRDHNEFKRLGNDLHFAIALELYLAVLGGDIKIDTLDDKVKLKVKPETQHDEKVILKGKRLPVYKKEGNFGCLHGIHQRLIKSF
ncbi:MAG: curved DNA-binding protein [Cyclobacteriaceae bacterium]|jgi:curved DNA-binding protein